MIENNVAMTSQTKKLLLLQSAASILVSIGFFLYQANILTAVSAIGGGVIAMVIGLMMRWDFSRAEKVASHDIKRSAVILYVGAVQRFFMVIALFVLGIFMNLSPLPLLVGFAAAQLCYSILVRGAATGSAGAGGGTTGL